jgi:hypothetical protein
MIEWEDSRKSTTMHLLELDRAHGLRIFWARRAV